MKKTFYGDNRDLVKWSVLINLAKKITAKRILQIAYFRPNDFGGIEMDGEPLEIPPEIKYHFRNIRRIGALSSQVKVSVFDAVLEDRKDYLNQTKKFIESYSHERCVVLWTPTLDLHHL